MNEKKEIRESGENYLEVILEIADELGEVRSVEVARRLGVSRASVSKAIGVLRDANLVEPAFYGEIVLTPAGVKRAQAVRHRHDVLTQYLMEHLGLPEEVAAVDACRMEHIVSEDMMRSIEAQLAQTTNLPVRLIACDMDGTLLDSAHNLPADMPVLLHKLEEMRVHFAVASGRQYQNLYQKFAALPHSNGGTYADRIFYLGDNGALVAHGAEVLQVAAFDTALLEATIDRLRTIPRAQVVYCGKQGAYIETLHDEGHAFAQEAVQFFTHCHVVADVKQMMQTDTIFKIAVYHDGDAENVLLPALQVFDADMKIMLSGTDWVDLMPFGVSKGAGLQTLCDHLHLKTGNCLAFGDYLNDMEMLELAGYAYIMENAHPKLKEIYTNVAPSNNDNGVIRSISKFFGMEE